MTKYEKKKLVEQISSSFYNSVRGNSKIQRIITDGASTSEEVAWLAKLLGAYLRSAVAQNFTDVELLEGEAMSELAKEILEPLMKYSYTLISKANMNVVAIFNEQNSISITPKLPDFPKARFDQIVSAAGEEGKLRETILRRISVVPETVVTNMRDQNTRAVAKTYSSAGFETYIKRSDGAGCCNWCSKLVGKFEYPENTPKDVFRRHDNCNCIVTYVCGKMRQNVHSKETWEQPDVTVPELTRNPDVTVPELARGLLTEGEKSGIIYQGNSLHFVPLTQETVVPILRKESDEWIKQLSKEEERAIKKYTKNSGDPKDDKFYARLNSMLRGEYPSDSTLEYYSKLISNGLSKYELKNDIICYRALSFDAYEGFNIGEIFIEPQFVSTSVTKSKALNLPFKITIRVPQGGRGAYIENLSKYPNQREFLIDKNVPFRVISKTNDHIELEMII